MIKRYNTKKSGNRLIGHYRCEACHREFSMVTNTFNTNHKNKDRCCGTNRLIGETIKESPRVQAIIDDIHDLLNKSDKPVKSIDIAVSIGVEYTESRAILYRLERAGAIEKSTLIEGGKKHFIYSRLQNQNPYGETIKKYWDKISKPCNFNLVSIDGCYI